MKRIPLTLLLLLLGPHTALAQIPLPDLPLLANDKEARSRYLESRPDPTVSAVDPDSSRAAFLTFGETLQVHAQERFFCEVPFLLNFQSRLQEISPSVGSRNLRALFRDWRLRNWVDDLLLEILEQALPALSSTSVPRAYVEPNRYTGHLLKKFVSRRGISPSALSLALEPWRSVGARANPCLVDSWLETRKNLEQLAPGNPSLRMLLAYARLEGLLSGPAFKSAWDLIPSGVETWQLRLGSYLEKLAALKNRDRPSGIGVSRPNPFSSDPVEARSRLTHRKRLYLRFDSVQVFLLTSLLKRFISRMESPRAALVFGPDAGEEIPLSPVGQYQWVRKLLLRDFRDLGQSAIFRGTPFTFEDVITASLETGLIDSAQLESILKVDDLWNPRIPPWARLSSMALQVSGSAVFLLPSPYPLLASIALLFIEMRLQRRLPRTDRGVSLDDPF